MDYYVFLPCPYFQALRMTLVVLNHQKYTRLQQLPGGKQLNFTCVCYKLPQKTLWLKFPRWDSIVGVPQSGLWTKMLSISIN